jgi:glycosyltransferase involved in cell wall biosynthesis
LIKREIIIYEAPSAADVFFISRESRRDVPVWIIEPFHAYHHEKGIRFFPRPIPEPIERMLGSGEISLLSADDLHARDIYFKAADKAVEFSEKVFPEYARQNESLIKFVCDTVQSPAAEYIFRKYLCDRLASFYSVNIMLERISQHFPGKTIRFHSDIDVYTYLRLKELLIRGDVEVFEHTNVTFSSRTHVKTFLEKTRIGLIAYTRLIAQTAASLILGREANPSGEKRTFKYGIAINSPARQLADNQRGPTLTIDHKKIRPEEALCLPLVPLTENQQQKLQDMGIPFYQLPSVKANFSHFGQWVGFLWVSFRPRFFKNADLINHAALGCAEHFRWIKVLKNFDLKHFLIAADFGVSHIARNITLNQHGVETWYYTDSMNLGLNYAPNGSGCHPFWTYLHYDHFVTWDRAIADYYSAHPQALKYYHIVGCLWSEHINTQGKTDEAKPFIVAAFDTTYTRNSIASYEEGMAFARHLLCLAEEYPEVTIIIKEKKDKEIHHRLDPVHGPALVKLYDEMAKRPNIKIYGDHEDASLLTSLSDMVISFPFTSTTFEALSANKPAIWHDPLGYYRDTPYGKIGGVVTHSYNELKGKVLEIMKMKPGAWQNPIPLDSPLLDPFRDGRAIERFRELLTDA